MTTERLELRLPLKSQYDTVLRAATGVIAGMASFPFDEVMQVRVAVSEVFAMMMQQLPLGDDLPQKESNSGESSVVVKVAIQPDGIEILMTSPPEYRGLWDAPERQETVALLETLMDEVECTVQGTGAIAVRMIKRKAAE